MKHFKVYSNMNDYTVVEAESAIKAQWKAGYMPVKVVECTEDGGVKLPEGYEKINTNNKNHTNHMNHPKPYKP